MMAGLVIVSGYTSINAVVKAELFPARIRALGVGLPYALTGAIFGGTTEYVALWLKNAGHESWFFFYVAGAGLVSLLVYVFMGESSADSHLEKETTELAFAGKDSGHQQVPLERMVDRYHQVYGEGVVIVDSDGRTLAARGLPDAEPGVAAAADLALVDAPVSPWTRILPWDRHHLLAAAGVRRDRELVGAVVMAVDTSVAARDIAYGWLWVVVGCLALILAAALVGRGLTRWVLRPLDGLERAVAEMTEGVAGLPADVAGPPELRASLDRQRRLAADSLDNYVAEAGRPTYGSMTKELDRLENLLQQLLRLARAEEMSGSRKAGLAVAAESTELGAVIAERLSFWEPAAAGQGHALRQSGSPRLPVQLARHDVEQLFGRRDRQCGALCRA